MHDNYYAVRTFPNLWTSFLVGFSFARYSVGEATVSFKVFPGICHIQHNHIFTPPCRICDYTVCQYHRGRKGIFLSSILFILLLSSYEDDHFINCYMIQLFCTVIFSYTKVTYWHIWQLWIIATSLLSFKYIISNVTDFKSVGVRFVCSVKYISNPQIIFMGCKITFRKSSQFVFVFNSFFFGCVGIFYLTTYADLVQIIVSIYL